MDKRNWAERTKKSKTPMDAHAGGGGDLAITSDEPPSTALVTTKAGGGGGGGKFIVPRPGMDGALDANVMSGRTFVLTGTFPELGGGSGLDLGKERCKAMVQAFGGRVTSSVSRKTDYLVVGKSPGAGKVAQAKELGVKMVDITGLQKVFLGGGRLDDEPEPKIMAFSEGYRGNGLANKLGTGAVPQLALTMAPDDTPAEAPPRPAAVAGKKKKRTAAAAPAKTGKKRKAAAAAPAPASTSKKRKAAAPSQPDVAAGHKPAPRRGGRRAKK
jgi:BRCA1 C Terminus (BRCT) domain